MKENTLLKIALVGSLIGLLALYLISAKIDFKNYSPGELNKNVGDDVKLIGTVSGIRDAGDVVFIEVEHQTPVTVVLFTDDGDLRLGNGDFIEVLGEVQEYRGKDEVIARKIRVIR